MFVGPMPPATGGIASIMAMLQDLADTNPEIQFVDSSVPDSWWRRIFLRRCGMILTLAWRCRRMRGGTVVFFAGAFNSFWEKCTWAALVRVLGARPVLVMVDGNFPRFYAGLSPFVQRLGRKVMNLIDALGVQSPAWQVYYDSVFPNTRKVVVQGGVDVDYFMPSEEPRTGDCISFLYVGWMIAAKGIWDLLDAAALLKKQTTTSFRLRLIGPAFGQEGEIQARIRAACLEGIVDYGGRLSQQGLLQEFHAAQVFILPSHFEGFPVALLEALSCGLACVATNVGGCFDILDRGKAGILTEPHNPQELANAMVQLMNDVELRLRLSRAARERAKREYSFERSLESYRGLIDLPKWSD